MISRRPLCCLNSTRDSVDEHRCKTVPCHQCFADTQSLTSAGHAGGGASVAGRQARERGGDRGQPRVVRRLPQLHAHQHRGPRRGGELLLG